MVYAGSVETTFSPPTNVVLHRAANICEVLHGPHIERTEIENVQFRNDPGSIREIEPQSTVDCQMKHLPAFVAEFQSA